MLCWRFQRCTKKGEKNTRAFSLLKTQKGHNPYVILFRFDDKRTRMDIVNIRFWQELLIVPESDTPKNYPKYDASLFLPSYPK